ncbi:MAG TPA: cytochrome c [Steroidobacteraceae bacterium]|nr:cytochrome c [Steroidobacteraceae bacterium]
MTAVRWLLAIALAGLAVVIAACWYLSGTGPLSFAGTETVRLADYKESNPTGVPAELAQSDLISQGRYLTVAADCQACHTREDGVPFAGGRAFKTPFGTLYSSNITPDRETGIGAWSDGDFLRAVHKGVRPDGAHLYPAFPYAAYTYLTDADVQAIWAYLRSIPATRDPVPANALAFPFNQRWLMGIWSVLFNPDRRFAPNVRRSAEWNRGAYLAEGLEHCGDCHTPRNVMQGLNNRRKFNGALTAGWQAYNITSHPTSGIGGWSEEALAQYLATGHAASHGTASGPMGEAVDLSLSKLTSSDIRALVTYLRSIPPIASPKLPAVRTEVASTTPPWSTSDIGGDSLGQQVFAGACTGCHGWTGSTPLLDRATLTGSRAINDPSAVNVVQMILNGSGAGDSNTTGMPAFGAAYTDAEIAAVANYLTGRFGAKASAVSARTVAHLRSTT